MSKKAPWSVGMPPTVIHFMYMFTAQWHYLTQQIMIMAMRRKGNLFQCSQAAPVSAWESASRQHHTLIEENPEALMRLTTSCLWLLISWSLAPSGSICSFNHHLPAFQRLCQFCYTHVAYCCISSAPQLLSQLEPPAARLMCRWCSRPHWFNIDSHASRLA